MCFLFKFIIFFNGIGETSLTGKEIPLYRAFTAQYRIAMFQRYHLSEW